MSQREIKLRVWEFARPKDDFNGAMTYIDWANDYSVWLLRYCFKPENKHAYAIMQFTGLKDKNGKEIYEGDVLRITGKPPYDDVIPLIRKVSFQPLAPACGFILGDAERDYIEHFGRIMKDDDTDWDVDVIGNIHENPNLLK